MPPASTPAPQNSTKPNQVKPTQAKPTEPVSIGGRKFDVNSTEYRGQLFSIKYRGNNNWVICKIGPVACLGFLPNPQIGAEYTLKGEWELNTKYGHEWQFRFKSYTCQIDASKGLKELLVRECKHIGPALAVQLVTRFGNDTLKVLAQDTEEDKAKVLALPHISAAAAESIREWVKLEKSTTYLKQKLYGIGLLPAQIDKLISAYGYQAEQKLKQDCFALTEVKGFGFKTVAKIADLLGIPTTDPGRIRAAIHYQLEEGCREWGHCCVVVSELIRQVASLCNITQAHVEPVLAKMLAEEELITANTNWKEYAASQGIILPD